MVTERRLLGAATITSSNAVALIKEVRTKLNVKKGDLVGFYRKNDGTIMVHSGPLSGGEVLLGSSTLTTSQSITLPKKIRVLLKVTPGYKIAFIQEHDDTIIIEK